MHLPLILAILQLSHVSDWHTHGCNIRCRKKWKVNMTRLSKTPAECVKLHVTGAAVLNESRRKTATKKQHQPSQRKQPSSCRAKQRISAGRQRRARVNSDVRAVDSTAVTTSIIAMRNMRTNLTKIQAPGYIPQITHQIWYIPKKPPDFIG